MYQRGINGIYNQFGEQWEQWLETMVAGNNGTHALSPTLSSVVVLSTDTKDRPGLPGFWKVARVVFCRQKIAG